jgi:hypothetical protein
MKKPYKHTELDETVKCGKCKRPLKKNVVTRKLKTPNRCYRCYKIEERQSRNGL